MIATYPEHRLAEAMSNYRNRSNPAYDPKFCAELEAIVPTRHNDAGPRKQMILDFTQQHGRQPSKTSADPLERKLAQSLTTYTAPTHRCYDPEFCERIGWVRRVDRQKQIRQTLIEWVQQNGRRPNGRIAEEKTLRQQLDQQAKLDPAFKTAIDSLAPIAAEKGHTGRSEEEQAKFNEQFLSECLNRVRAWHEQNQRMPSPQGTGEEAYVYYWLCRNREEPKVVEWFHSLPAETRFGHHSFTSRFAVLVEWVETNQRFPLSTATGFEGRLFNFSRSARGNPAFLSWFAELPDEVRSTTKLKLDKKR